MTKSKKSQKYEIIGKFPSIVGFATKSVKSGETVSLATQLALYNHQNVPDEDITVAHSQIYSTLSQWIYPIILKTFSNKKLPKDFILYAVYIEMHADESKNKILINEDTGFKITCKLKNKKELKKNDPIHMGDIDYLTSIQKENKNLNTATILLMQVNGSWFGKFDIIYNRENVVKKLDRAIDFFNSAIQNFTNSNMTGFYQSLWDSSELLAESVLLLHNQIKLRTGHKKIKEVFKEFCSARQITYFKDFEKIGQIRNNSRYGPPHPEYGDADRDSNHLLQNTNDFLRFVLDFLKERQVSPSSEEFQKKIDINAIEPKKKSESKL